MCCCTSTTTLMSSPVAALPVMSSALYSSGRCSASNSTSSTGPMTCTTLPMFFIAVVAAMLVPRVIDRRESPALASLSLQRRGAADDLSDLLRDVRLARPVVRAPQDVEHVRRVVCRVLHRGPLRAVERGGVLHECAVDHVAHVRRQQRGKNLLRGREEQIILLLAPVFARRRHGEDLLCRRRGRDRRPKMCVHDVDG